MKNILVIFLRASPSWIQELFLSPWLSHLSPERLFFKQNNLILPPKPLLKIFKEVIRPLSKRSLNTLQPIENVLFLFMDKAKSIPVLVRSCRCEVSNINIPRLIPKPMTMNQIFKVLLPQPSNNKFKKAQDFEEHTSDHQHKSNGESDPNWTLASEPLQYQENGQTSIYSPKL